MRVDEISLRLPADGKLIHLCSHVEHFLNWRDFDGLGIQQLALSCSGNAPPYQIH